MFGKRSDTDSSANGRAITPVQIKYQFSSQWMKKFLM